MKLSLLKILNENLESKLDTIINWFMDDVTIEIENHDYSTSHPNSLLDDSTALDIYYQRMMDDDSFINKLGWNHNTNDMNTDSYYVKDGETYERDEFENEFFYDMLDYLIDMGVITYDGKYYDLVNKDIHVTLPESYIQHFIYWSYNESKYVAEVWLLRDIEKSISNFYDFPKEWVRYITKGILKKIQEKIENDFGYNLDFEDLGVTLNESIVDDFIEFGKKELLLGDDFKINLTNDSDEIETLANYDMGSKEINVLTKNRAIPDIIRSIAHEMVHHNQNDRGDLRGVPEEGEVGSPWEDEANTKAGQLVRKFGEMNPEIYDL